MDPVLKGGGAELPLPNVVRELLRDTSILTWHPDEEVNEVMDGPSFERRWVGAGLSVRFSLSLSLARACAGERVPVCLCVSLSLSLSRARVRR